MYKVCILLFLALFCCKEISAQKASHNGAPITINEKAPAGYKYVRCINMENYEEMLEAQDPTRKTRRQAAIKMMNDWIANQAMNRASSVQTEYTIPVVFHVLWNSSTPDEKISLAQIKTQIKVMNQDYNRLNADTVNTPGAFKPVAANFHITFCLAQTDPNGNLTTGVVYKQTSSTAFSDSKNDAKYPSLGGDTIWNPNKYLNIWVCNLAGGVLGYSEFPTSPLDNTFGSVINYESIGDSGYLPLSQYNLGRTVTHEVGHLLNLHHPWGDDGGACPGGGGVDDGCADTPPEGNNKSGDGFGSGYGPTFGNPPFPYTDNCSTSSPGIMVENFMEYTDDKCMNLFTQDQYTIALATLNGPLAKLITSTTCNNPNGIDQYIFDNTVNIYPNPSATGKFTVSIGLTNFSHINIRVFNVMGQMVGTWSSDNHSYTLDLSGQPEGLYFAKIYNDNFSVVKKIMIYR